MFNVRVLTENQLFVCYLFMADHLITISLSGKRVKTFLMKTRKKVLSREVNVLLLVMY